VRHIKPVQVSMCEACGYTVPLRVEERSWEKKLRDSDLEHWKTLLLGRLDCPGSLVADVSVSSGMNCGM
jgi:hypothetical protein